MIPVVIVQAIPFGQLTQDHASSEISHIAVNENAGHYLAFRRDGSMIGRYKFDKKNPTSLTTIHTRDDVSMCADLSVDEAKTLPGWDTLTKYTDDNWGKKSRNIVTNPKEYLGMGAQVCIQSDTVQFSSDAQPDCQSQSFASDGKLSGTSGEVSIEVQTGFNLETTLTTTNATAEVSMGVEFTNTNSKTTTTQYNGTSTGRLTLKAPQGKTCNANLEMECCTLSGTGTVNYIASGWVWFNYNDKTDGHYKWAVSVDSTLTNIADRSSQMEVKGLVKSESHMAYNGTCD
ncbi:hypothetical protein K435DRAFT_812482 [Dendrothele bispora CBS 962.96]|uniref:Uncharacterized protein n=1 Tax=Dendrothele bispora (strain CBS 962.96) TaxID=1314807 RepID=A0A4S8KP59_DENBC|nr:hypothetical protein K435DRAFT_812482 [Dendrothele bispora CBS 962.96]